jgi:SAM-dependent methyltransferase
VYERIVQALIEQQQQLQVSFSNKTVKAEDDGGGTATPNSSTTTAAATTATATALVDVGCGSGQATWGLAQAMKSRSRGESNSSTNNNQQRPPLVDWIIGIDPSLAQIQQARGSSKKKFVSTNHKDHSFPKVEFYHGHDYNLVQTLQQNVPTTNHNPLSVICITAAQAAHWFDLSQFYHQVDQLFTSNNNGGGGGVLALWTYGNLQILTGDGDKNDNNAMTTKTESYTSSTQHDFLVNLQKKIMVDLYEDILGDQYWDPRRKHAETLYRELPQIQQVLSSSLSSSSLDNVQRRGNDYSTEYICWEETTNPDFCIRQTMTRQQLVGYLRSWSGYMAYVERNQEKLRLQPQDDPVDHIDSWIQQQQSTNSLPLTFYVRWPIAMLLSKQNN